MIYLLHTIQKITFSALISNPQVPQFGKPLKWKKSNELSEYEPYHRFSIPNHLNKILSTSNFLLTVSSTTDPYTTAFSFADLSTASSASGPSITAYTTVSSTYYLLLTH